MTTYRTKRLVGNPHHRTKKKKKKSKSRRRNMSPKQIRIFGSKAQKAALKRRLKSKRRGKIRVARKSHRPRTKPHAANPRRKKRRTSIPYAKNRRRKKAKKVAKKRRSRNSALVFTLGSVNPRSTHMKKKRRRKSSAGARKNRRRKNTHRRTVIRYVTRSRKRNSRRRSRRRPNTRHRHHHRRRNPTLFGHHVSGVEMLMAIGGGLIGVTIAKLVPPMLPAQFTSNPYFRVAVVAGVAFAAGWAAQKVNPRFGDAVLFGGLMQAGSILLNVFLPSIGGAIGLSGLSELMPGAFAVPQNPLRLPPPPPVSPTQARIQVNGLQRAYGDAF